MSSYTTSPYCYSPLLPDNIRLLRLLPHKHKDAPIQCQLFRYSLQESNTRTHPYEALSYVWGTPKKCHVSPPSISIDNHDMPVTENLYKALSRLRYHSLERILWVDAVCIDQTNTSEQEKQIQFMARIYAQATRVVVWLGEATHDSDEALKETHDSDQALKETHDSNQALKETHGSDQALKEIRIAASKGSTYPSSNKMIQDAVIELLQREWFRRIWVRE